MGNYEVILKVPILNVGEDAAEALYDDPILFIDDHDLYDEAVVEGVRLVD